MKGDTGLQLPTHSASRPEVAGITGALARKGYTPAQIHDWLNLPRRDLAMADTPLSPKQWLAGGGSARRVLALARIAPAPKPTQEATHA